MRGTHFPYLRDEFTGGIIPAYAGNTKTLRHRKPAYRDHPRVCGEHSSVSFLVWWLTGSSPRMRGTPRKSASPDTQSRIIPAYAGNTYGHSWCPLSRWDHPRVCGEHPAAMRSIGEVWGSSPRMRGTHANPIIPTVYRGIIPAYAGNTCEPYHSNGLPWDHPRVCGEHPDTMRPERVLRGSSPRMRGTPYHVRCVGR